MKYTWLFARLLKFRLAGGSKPKIFEESSEEEEDEETPEEKGKRRHLYNIQKFWLLTYSI